jgi:ABC-2 type transport system permease protein
MRSVITLALKDLRLLTRNRLGLFWMVVFPLLLALFFGSLFGSPNPQSRALTLAVVDEDGSDASRAYVARLSMSEALRVEALPRDVAREQVRKGERTAYLVLPPGFGQAAHLFTGQPATLQVGIDPSRRAEAGYLQGILLEALYTGLQEDFADPRRSHDRIREAEQGIARARDLRPEQKDLFRRFFSELDGFLGAIDRQALPSGAGWQPAKVEAVPVTPEETGPRSAFEITFPSSVLWGILGCVQTFVISVVSERAGGTFLRLRLAPLSWGQILAGKGLACFLACAGVAALLLTLGRLVFGVRLVNLPGLLLAIACTAACFVGMMMLLCTLGKTVEGVAGSAWGILMPLAMLGGGMIPLIAMPGWMLTLSHISPVKWGILALEGAIWRGFGLAEMLLPCMILVGVGAVCFAAGVAVLSRGEA